MKNLLENVSWRRSSGLFRRFFRLTNTFCLSFLHLNFTKNDSFFFKRWQACKSLGLTSCPVKESALQMCLEGLIDGGMLQFLVMAKSDETTSNVLKKSSNRFVKSKIFEVMPSTVTSSSMSSSFERFEPFW